MAFTPPIYGFIPQSTQRAKAASALRAMQDTVSPLVAKGDPLSLLMAQQQADDLLVSDGQQLSAQTARNRSLGTQVKSALAAPAPSPATPAAATGPDQSLLGGIAQTWRDVVPQGVRSALGETFHAATSAERALDVLLPGEPGTAIGEFVGKAPVIGGAARTAFDAGLSPLSLASAGLGAEVGAPALAALKGAGIGGKAIAAVAGPVVGGGFKANIAAQTAAAIGGKYGSQLGSAGAEALGGGETAQTIGGIAGGLLGGAAGVGAVKGVQGIARGIGEQQAREAIRAAAPEASQIGRAAGTDDLFTADMFGKPVGPTGNVGFMEINGRQIPTPLAESIPLWNKQTLDREAQAALDAWHAADPDGFAQAQRYYAAREVSPTVSGTAGGAPKAQSPLTPDEFAALAAKKARGEALTPEEDARVMEAAGRALGATTTEEQAAAREAFYRDPANLGDGIPLTPDQQANIQGTVQRAGQLNTITDSLANARAGEVGSGSVLARGEVPPPHSASFVRPDGSVVVAAKGTEHDALANEIRGDGVGPSLNNIMNEDGWVTMRQGLYGPDNLVVRVGHQAPTPGQMAAIKDASAGQQIDYILYGPTGGDSGAMVQHANFEQFQRAVRDTYAGRPQSEVAQFHLAGDEPSALDKVIGRNADTLPEPTRTQPPPGYLDRFKRPAAGGADLPGAQQPMVPRSGSVEPPTSSVTRSTTEPLAEPQNLAPESYPYQTFPGPKFGSVEADYQQGARGTLPGERPVSDYGMQGTRLDVPAEQHTGSIGENLGAAANAPRTIMASGDLSYSLRQNAMLAPSHPQAWWQSMKDQVAAYKSPEAAQQIQQRILGDADYPLFKRMGLDILPLDAGAGRNAEEGFMAAKSDSVIGRLVNRIPLVERSARSATIAGNVMRTGVAKDILRTLPEAQLTDQTLTALGDFINAATGRGKLPEVLKEHATTLNSLFFSPRNFLGKVQTNLAVFSQDPAVRKEAAKSLAAFYGTGIGILALAKLAGANVGVVPTSSDFGKITLPGGTRIDIWGGNQQLFRLMANLATGQATSARTGDTYDQSRITTLQRFLESKLAPVPSTALAASQGRTTDNEQLRADPGTLGTQALRMVTPLFLQDLYDATKNSGPAEGLTAGVLSGLGVGATAYQKGPADDLSQQTYGKPYAQLTGPERGDLNRAHPELAGQLLTEQAKASGQSGQAAQFRQQTRSQQEASDRQLVNGEITREQWQQQRGDRAQRQRGALEAIYGPAQAITEAQAAADPLKRYLKAIADTTDPATGVVDSAALAAQRATWGDALNAQIDKSLGTNDTPLERLYREAASAYYDQPRYKGYTSDEARQIDGLWTRARAAAKSSSDLDMQRALRQVIAQEPADAKIVTGVRRRIAGTLPQDSKRKTLATRDPLAAFFFGSKALNPSQRAAFTERLGTLGAAA